MRSITVIVFDPFQVETTSGSNHQAGWAITLAPVYNVYMTTDMGVKPHSSASPSQVIKATATGCTGQKARQ